MRFHAIHKLASYLMAGCAFGAVALSDELNAIVVLGGLAGIVVSWFWEPPRVRPERWSVWWNAAALAAFAYTVLAVFIGGSWIVGGTQLLVFLLIAKLFNRRTSRDYQWVYVVSFLLLVAGTTLNAELSYALCFIGYVVFATWALILFHLRREMEDNFLLKHSDDSSSERVEVERILNSRRIVGGKFLAGTSAVSLAIFIISTFLFLLFPRVGFGLFFQQNRHKVTMAGLNESGVTLGGHGRILDDDTVVMRVKVSDGRFKGLDAPAIHWRAVSFDQYHDGRWFRSRDAFPTPLDAEVEQRKTYVTIDHPFLPSWRNQGEWREGLVRQEIFLEPIDTTSLIAASRPVGFELPDATPGRFKGQLARSRNRNDDVRHYFNGQIAYVAYSDLRRPDEALLRAARDVDDTAMAPYLKLPASLPQRVHDLAREITAGREGPWAKALAVEQYLRDNFTYTLDLDTDDTREPLDYFLFDRKKGHCEYFASAEAILLRAVGVPTRNVNGFAGGEWNEYGGYWAVRAGDAHSWVEIWIDGVGWVTRDPTPPAVAPLGRGGGDVFDKLRRMVDTLRLKWFKWVIEYDLGRQLGLFKDLGKSLGLSGKGETTKNLKAFVKEHKWALLGGAAGLVGLIVLARRLRRGRTARVEDGQHRKHRTPSHPVITLWTKSAKKLARQGFVRPPSQTPREHASALLDRGAPGSDPFARLTELYYTARFAASDERIAEVDVEDARRLADEIEQAVARAAKEPRPPARLSR